MRRLRSPLRRRRRESTRGPETENAGLGSSLPLRDLLAESSAALLARPARVALTVLGTVVGVAARMPRKTSIIDGQLTEH